MIPEGPAGIPAWVFWLVGGGGLTSLIGALLLFVSTRKRDTQSAVAERFDDAKEITSLIRAEVEVATEKLRGRVGELESAVESLRAEARNLHGGIREWATRLWAWNRSGRPGPMPGPPERLRESVDLDYLLDETEEIDPGTPGSSS